MLPIDVTRMKYNKLSFNHFTLIIDVLKILHPAIYSCAQDFLSLIAGSQGSPNSILYLVAFMAGKDV